MKSSARSKFGGVSRSGGSGAQLRQELEDLSQALAKSIPVQSSKIDVSAATPEKPAARERRTSEVIPKVLPSKPPLRHSVSAIRSNPPAADEGQGKKMAERSRRSEGEDAGSSPEWLMENARLCQTLEAPLEKKSLWNWKPFRALAHLGQQRFNCGFSAHVHGVKDLPTRMNGMRLTVHFRHKDSSVQTLPSRVHRGAVEFDETLHHKCAIFGSRKPSQGIKYMSKSFTLTVVALDMDELELGKHRLDLSHLLPETMDEKTDKENFNTSTTSFSLSGKAKGGSLLVTFGYEILASEKESSFQVGNTSARFGDSSARRRALSSFNSVPNSPHPMLRSLSTGMPLSSPALSEPTSDLADFLGMDRLNLDEVFNQEETLHKQTNDSKQEMLPFAQLQIKATGHLSTEVKNSIHNDLSIAPHTPGQSVESSNLVNGGPNSRRLGSFHDGISEGDTEFLVEDRGLGRRPFPGEVQNPEAIVAGTEASYLGGNGHLQNVMDDLTAATKLPFQKVSFRQSNSILQEESDASVEQYVLDTLQTNLDQNRVPEKVRDDDDHLINHGSLGLDLSISAMDHDGLKSRTYLRLSNDDSFAESLNLSKGQRWQLFPASTQQEIQEKAKVVESDEDTDNITGEFLNMLQGVQGLRVPSSDSEADSPRAILLKQFEQEALLESGFGLNPNLPQINDLHQANIPLAAEVTEVEQMGWHHDFATSFSTKGNELAEIMDAAESELQIAAQTMRSKARAKMLEDAEAEALMQKWGLDERAFESSPPKFTDDYAYRNASKKHLEAPPLAYGFGSVVPTRDGGELRSMSSAPFQRGYTGGQLVMHVSKPVVVPADMGASALDILRRMAASGVENMAIQAMLSMPLEDITGKSVHQIAFEGQTALELSGNRYGSIDMGQGGNRCSIDYTTQSMAGDFLSDTHSGSLLTCRPRTGARTVVRHKRAGEMNSEDVVSLEDLGPVAMEKIEALALEGLKIQSDMAEEEAPYSLDEVIWKEADSRMSGMPRHDAFNSLEEVAATQFLEGSSSLQEVEGDGFMSMAISLEEWMRLDSGVYDEAGTKEDTLAILAAHNANHTASTSEKELVQNKGAKPSASNGGFMGNTLTLAMLVQLRDPLRNYEPVGAPMMALVQAERVVIPPRPKLWKRVSTKGNNEDDDNCQNKTEQVPQFKITGIHISGLKSGENNKEDKKKLWGNKKQQQSGSRWLLANGMAKTAKPALLKSNPESTTTKSRQSESLWSLSSRVQDTGNKWQQSSGRSSLVRNPDVMFSKKGVKKW